jgi:hypothetical protein
MDSGVLPRSLGDAAGEMLIVTGELANCKNVVSVCPAPLHPALALPRTLSVQHASAPWVW